MPGLIVFLICIWGITQLKAILFWLYLWQLKEYHIGRFKAHFETYKGKRIFLNPLFIFKVLILLYAFFLIVYPTKEPLPWYFYGVWVLVLILLYLLEDLKIFLSFIKRRLKVPVFTSKIILLFWLNLIFWGVLVLLVFLRFSHHLFWFVFCLLLFDIFSPLLVSGIVLGCQPFVVWWRRGVIEKAKKKREKFKNLIVVGITGSYGKSSTKEILATILAKKFKVLKTEKNQNSEIGISRCILNNLNEDHEVFVVEMGAYNKGGIKLLCDITKPQIGILTGICPQHLSTFGSLENIINTKYELIESLPPMGFSVFNGDDKYCSQLYQKTEGISKRICYSKFLAEAEKVVKGDYWVREIKSERSSLTFEVFSRRWGEIVQFKVNLPGSYWAQNILMAAIVAKEILGMSLEEIAKACQELKAEQLGVRLLRGVNNTFLICSTYSANPQGVMAHLDYLDTLPHKKIIVMPCLIELGSASRVIHYEIGKRIGEVCDLCIVTTLDRFEEIGRGAKEVGLPPENILFSENPKEIFEKIKYFAEEGDTILLEGRVPKGLVQILTKKEAPKDASLRKPNSLDNAKNVQQDSNG